MTQVPDVPNEQRSFEDETPRTRPVPVERNGKAPGEPGHADVEASPDPDGRFGTLKQYALNRWSVHDRGL